MSYASPLGVYIHPKGWTRPAGNYEPTVTATFADHIAGGRNPGVDIGTGRCGDPIYAPEAGVVSLAGLIGTAKVVRIKLANGDEFGFAHLATINVTLGQKVIAGQKIGTLGMTGASACHLHLGLKRGGVEIDAWPLLDQNGETMPGFKIGTNIGTFTFVGAHALISPIDTKVRYIQAPDAGPWNVAASLDLKKADGTPIDIDGTSPPLNHRDQVYLVDAPAFGIAAYALRQEGAFTPKEDAAAARAAGIADAAKAAAAVK